MFSYFVGGLVYDYEGSPDVSLADIFFVVTYIFLMLGLILAVVTSRINLPILHWSIVLGIGILGSLLSWWIYQISPETDKTFIAIFLNYFYVVSDVLLLIMATTLLLTFWGGKASLSWRMISAAAFCLYIADVWFSYAQATQGDNYQSGDLLEVFWIFSGILFGIGATLENHISLNRKHRFPGKK
jgi:hypothetical protein